MSSEAFQDGDDEAAGQVRRQALLRRAGIQAHRASILGSGLFDAAWYLRHAPDANASDLDPLDHYLSFGVGRRISPGPLFDTADYLRQAWHLRPGIDDPLSHYLAAGHAETMLPRSVIDAPTDHPLHRRVEPFRLLPPPSHRPSLAVAVHVFHVDLFDEICDALARLPYRYTLLVSTDSADKERRIRDIVASRGLETHLRVHVCENRGRNFAPFLTALRDSIRAHDLVLHLHTKKSLYRGYEQSDWRASTLRTLLPAGSAVSGLIQRFNDDPALGVLTAAPGEAVRYWAFNWLSNRHLAQSLHDRLGLDTPVPDGMFDYPMGGMFWARTSALRRLLDHPWHIEDFPPELGQTDGTLMHAIERVVVLAAADAGFGFAELDYANGLVRSGWSSRNLDQYRRASHAGLLDTIGQVDTVSFDLFDTLLTRTCLSPDAVHRFIGVVAARRFPGASDYVSRRQQAERNARRARDDGEVDLDEIHAYFTRDAGPAWTPDAIAYVQREEVALDHRLLLPRTIMIEALAHAGKIGRRTLLTSDSYLSRPQLDRILEASGIATLVDEVYLSAQRRARKDRGDLWTLIKAQEAPARLLHVGDNEQSDIQRTADAGIRHFHVFPPAFLLARQGLWTRRTDGAPTLGDDILLGPIAADLFNDPYLDRTFDHPLILSDPEQAGRILLGPLLFAFVAWIVSHPAVRHLDRLFFVSREGWFLKRLYDAIVPLSGRSDLPPATYFHCSRRVALAALQAEGLDPEPVLRGAGYNGSLSDFFRARLGFMPDETLCHGHDTIALPRDNDLVRCMMDLMRAPIVSHGKTMARGLRAYAASVGMEGDGRFGFVDVGYSGTMQTALQAVLNTRLIGLYMGVSHDAAQVKAGGGHAFGAFADGNVAEFTGGYGLMLEAFLTASHGQTVGYDDSASPVRPIFRHDGVSQTVFPVLDAIYAGAEAYALSLLRVWGPEVLALPFRPDAATAMLEAVRNGRIVLGPDLTAVLSVEDDFCGRPEIPVFEELPASQSPP